MLILSRKTNETIVCGRGLVNILVISTSGDRVVLGIDAPKEMPVHRGEIQAAIDREREGVEA